MGAVGFATPIAARYLWVEVVAGLAVAGLVLFAMTYPEKISVGGAVSCLGVRRPWSL